MSENFNYLDDEEKELIESYKNINLDKLERPSEIEQIRLKKAACHF